MEAGESTGMRLNETLISPKLTWSQHALDSVAMSDLAWKV